MNVNAHKRTRRMIVGWQRAEEKQTQNKGWTIYTKIRSRRRINHSSNFTTVLLVDAVVVLVWFYVLWEIFDILFIKCSRISPMCERRCYAICSFALLLVTALIKYKQWTRFFSSHEENIRLQQLWAFLSGRITLWNWCCKKSLVIFFWFSLIRIIFILCLD